MKMRVLDWIVCPVDGSPLRVENAVTTGEGDDLDVVSGLLVCDQGHAFPIRDGVPRLRPDDLLADDSDEAAEIHRRAAEGKTIAASFGREWDHFDHDTSRTWHETVEDRQKLFMQEVALTQEQLRGKVVLDAGSGNGSHSNGISQLGCEVLGADVTDAVTEAHKRYSTKPGSRVHYIQADLMNPPFKPASVDVMYSSGVLHHNPDTKAALDSVLKSLKPGGTCYIWVYHMEPGLKFKLQLMLRSVVSRWPAPLKHTFVRVWSVQSMIRQHIRTLLNLNDEKDRLTWSERIVDLMDIYTPRYRFMHTQEEVKGWYAEYDMADVVTSEVRDWGFGVVGRLPTGLGSSEHNTHNSSEQVLTQEASG